MAPPLRPVPGSSGGYRQTVATRQLDHLRHLLRRLGEHHNLRQRAVDGGVVLEDEEVGGVVEDVLAAHDGCELTQDMLVEGCCHSRAVRYALRHLPFDHL